jgi:NADH-quinone oxidoreductase subunit A
MELQFSDFLYRDNILWISAFALGGLAFALIPICIVYIFMPRGTRQFNQKNSQAIECGMEPIGDPWIRYHSVFFLYALTFLAFAVDVLFLFPVALAYDSQELRDMGIIYADFVILVLFIGILALSIVYAWIKGVFKWERRTYLHR